MKRTRKALLGVLVSGALLFSAQAAELPDTANDILRSALTTVQQEIRDTGKISTTYFSGSSDTVYIHALASQRNLYSVGVLAVFSDGTSTFKYGILNGENGKLVVPVEYDLIPSVWSDGRALLGRETAEQQYDFWLADENGTLTPQTIPNGYTQATFDENSGLFILSKRVQKPLKDYRAPNEPGVVYVAQYAIADSNLNILRDNIDGGGSEGHDTIIPPEYHNGRFIIQTGSTLWTDAKPMFYCNGTFGLIDRTGNWIGRHDYDYLAWVDQHFIARHGGQYYMLDENGAETPAYQFRYSDWAQEEVDAANEHDLNFYPQYPKLDITRANFTVLAMKLYHVFHPNAEIPESDVQFTDCTEDDIPTAVQEAAALGIIHGYGDGTFRPYKNISRAEAASLLDNLYRKIGGVYFPQFSYSTYDDDAQIPEWSQMGVYWMQRFGIMKGKSGNKFCPKDGYTAEQAVVTMERMYQLLNETEQINTEEAFL